MGEALFDQNMGILNRSVERMKQLIEDLSDLSSIETAAILKKKIYLIYMNLLLRFFMISMEEL